jgi:hypothetical protein
LIAKQTARGNLDGIAHTGLYVHHESEAGVVGLPGDAKNLAETLRTVRAR